MEVVETGNSTRPAGLKGSVLCLITLLAVSGVAGSSRAQGFSNLDFEDIGADQITPDGVWLSWSLAAPRWQHASGGDSVFVYHNTPPTSHHGQYYFLADSASTKWKPLAGNYSLALVSGRFNRNDANSKWVHASIEQTGIIPEDSKTLRLLALGDFNLSVNSSPVNTYRVGDNEYAADISEFAGQLVNLKFSNNASTLHSPLILDSISFSPQMVPEPSASVLFGSALVAWLLRRRPAGR